MKITTIYLKRLRNEAHFEFFSAFIALITKYPFVRGKLGLLLDSLNELFAKEDVAVDLIRKSDYTTQIATADKRLDGAVVGFSDFVRGAMHHFNPAVAETALSLKNLLKTYGDIIHKNYDEELASITNLLQELDGAYASKVEQINGLLEWVNEMRVASVELKELLAVRNTELANRPQDRMVNIRREIDPAYRNIIARIEAHITIDGDAEYATFINELNALIERFNRHISTPKADKTEKNDNSEKQNEE